MATMLTFQPQVEEKGLFLYFITWKSHPSLLLTCHHLEWTHMVVNAAMGSTHPAKQIFLEKKKNVWVCVSGRGMGGQLAVFA